MRTLEGILAEHPFFRGWETRYFQLAVGCASNVRFNAGELLCQQGREANTFYLIAKERSGSKSISPVAAA